jgi:3-hydroxyisobutyrate dehydrogenase-like beta-hydroxyacid dehydrogenase
MGREIACRLEQAGRELVVWNRSDGPQGEFEERGATVAATPAEAARLAPLRVTMLADGAAVKAVVAGDDGVLAGADGGTLVEMSTIDLDSSARVAAAADEAGVAYVRAPVSGNPSVVAAGNLTILLSGPAGAIDAAEDTLAAIGPNLKRLGEADEARVMKLALNLVLAGTTELIAEAVVMAEASGVGREAVMETMEGSAIGSPFVGYKKAAVANRDYSPTFSIANLRKDLDLIAEQGDRVGVPLPATDVVRGLAAQCEADGMGELDLLALLPRLEREAGRR